MKIHGLIKSQEYENYNKDLAQNYLFFSSEEERSKDNVTKLIYDMFVVIQE